MTSDPVATGAPTAHGQRRRDRIVDAAAAAFDRDGFHGASIDDIGVAAGISGPGLYRHFDSKDALLTAVFDRIWARLRPAIAAAASLPASDGLELLIDAHTELATGDAIALRLLLRERRHVPGWYQRAAERNHRLYVDAWVGPLTELHPGLAQTEARTLALAVHGLIDSAATHPSDLGPEQRSAMLRRAARALVLTPP